MSEEKKELNERELNEAELDKVNGGVVFLTARGIKPPCDGGIPCLGSVCPEYASCTKSIKE